MQEYQVMTNDLVRQKQMLEIITVFSAKLYGSRSHKNKKLLNNLKAIIQDEQSK